MRGRVLLGLVAVAGCAWLAPSRPTTPGDLAVAPLHLPADARVMVFAPHPDDETLAVGGLLHGLVRQRRPVRVVFLTNGDGYRRALEEGLAIRQPTDDDYVVLGEMRQQEAQAAAHRLGLQGRDLRFLGFPDNGLEELWRAHWLRAHPYTSPYTKEDSPPYPDTVDPHVDYDGQDLLFVLSHVLEEFHPTVVIMPHPFDRHADHAHTSFFVTEALARFHERRPGARSPTVLTYLVHYPNWPATTGAH